MAGFLGIGVLAIVGSLWTNEPARAELITAGVVFLLMAVSLSVVALVRASKRKHGGEVP